MDFSTVEYLLAIVGTIVGTVGSLTWWLGAQFKITRDLIFKVKDEIIAKLEYHERHDDERFLSIRNDIWEIRLRNAALDGKKHSHDPKTTQQNRTEGKPNYDSN